MKLYIRDNYVTAYAWPEMTITKRAPYIIIHPARNAQRGEEVYWCQSCFQSLNHSCTCWFPCFRFGILDSRFQLFHMPNVKHLGVDTSVIYIAPVKNSALLSFARIVRKVLEMQRKTGFWLVSIKQLVVAWHQCNVSSSIWNCVMFMTIMMIKIIILLIVLILELLIFCNNLCSSKNYLYARQLNGTQGAKAWPVLRLVKLELKGSVQLKSKVKICICIYNKLNKFMLKLLNVQSSRAGDRSTGKIKKKMSNVSQP